MIHEWCSRALMLLTMILKSDSSVREFTLEERNVLHDAHSILSRHLLPTLDDDWGEDEDVWEPRFP